MKGEVNRRLRSMLRTVQAGLSTETDFGQCTVRENSADQKKSNKKVDSLLITHNDHNILEVSIFLDSFTLLQSNMIHQQNSLFCVSNPALPQITLITYLQSENILFITTKAVFVDKFVGLLIPLIVYLFIKLLE